MGIEDGTTTFQLSRPLEYKLNGATEYADHVVLKEPAMDHVQYYLKLKQMLMRAFVEYTKQSDELNELRSAIGHEVKPFQDNIEQIEAESDEMAAGIGLALQGSSVIDVGEFVVTFEKMACLKARKSVCMIDGQLAMTHALWNNLKPDDAFDMAVKWCSFFGMPSEGGDKISSGPRSVSPTPRTAA